MRIAVVVLFAVGGAWAQIGTVDTVGGTTHDWGLNGPTKRMICNSPEHGIHVLWMYSASDQTTFPDRNMRYNFYDPTTGAWNWIDPDHMQSGVDVFTERCGYGNLQVSPVSGEALVSFHSGSPVQPGLAKGTGGIFEFCPGPPGFLWPVIAVGGNGWVHVAMADDSTRDQVWYSRCTTWCRWETPVRLSGVGAPDPTWPNHNIAAALMTANVVVCWMHTQGNVPDTGYFRESTDGGTTWQAAETLPPPQTYGGDTLSSFHVTSLFPFYDRESRLHIVADVMPYVDGQGYIMPAQIWHWCRDNEPPWSRIHWAGCAPENLMAAVGYDAIYACRPSIGEDRIGGLHVCWEQFDSMNVEPGPPELLRADIFYARDNYDNGMTWQPAVKITEPGTVSHRFPCMIDYLYADTVCVTYMIDQVAGFFVQGEGPATNNPIVVHKVPVVVGGIEERGRQHVQRLTPPATIVRGVLRVPVPNRHSIFELLNSVGRKVAELEPGANDIRHLAPGVYFVRGEESRAKVIIQH